MKKTVLVFGLIAGLIVSGCMLATIITCSKNADFENSMWLGYVSMILAFVFIFVGIKSFRDKHHGGVISFGKGFRVGLYISLIASTMYVAAWLVEYYNFFPDFMDKYGAHMMRKAQESGASAAKLRETADSVAQYKEMYKNPLMVILMTYMEILPVALLASLISALILKRKTAKV